MSADLDAVLKMTETLLKDISSSERLSSGQPASSKQPSTQTPLLNSDDLLLLNTYTSVGGYHHLPSSSASYICDAETQYDSQFRCASHTQTDSIKHNTTSTQSIIEVKSRGDQTDMIAEVRKATVSTQSDEISAEVTPFQQEYLSSQIMQWQNSWVTTMTASISDALMQLNARCTRAENAIRTVGRKVEEMRVLLTQQKHLQRDELALKHLSQVQGRSTTTTMNEKELNRTPPSTSSSASVIADPHIASLCHEIRTLRRQNAILLQESSQKRGHNKFGKAWGSEYHQDVMDSQSPQPVIPYTIPRNTNNNNQEDMMSWRSPTTHPAQTTTTYSSEGYQHHNNNDDYEELLNWSRTLLS